MGGGAFLSVASFRTAWADAGPLAVRAGLPNIL
jgi:hypothetical protein